MNKSGLHGQVDMC